MNQKISDFYAFLPLLLACDEKYQKISARGCYLYSIMLSRMNLSEKNKHRFSDENGVYIYFSIEEMCKYLNCSKPTAIATVQELISAQLVKRSDVPRGKSPRYYVKPLTYPNQRSYSEPTQRSYSPPKQKTYNYEPSFTTETTPEQRHYIRQNFGTMKSPMARRREKLEMQKNNVER